MCSIKYKENKGYRLLKLLCCIDEKNLLQYSFECDMMSYMIIRYWNKNNNMYKKRSSNCIFYHKNLYLENNIEEFHNRYKLMTRKQCIYIVNNCCNNNL